MPLVRIEDRNGHVWFNSDRVNALTQASSPNGSNPYTKVWFASGFDGDGDREATGDYFVVYLPLDEVARLLNE